MKMDSKFRMSVRGESPLLCHSDKMVDVTNPLKKALAEISGKRKKTDDDHVRMSRLEFEGGLYHDDELGPVLPTANILACLKAGARLSKEGPTISRGILPMEITVPLIYDGPRDIEGLLADGRFISKMSVVVQGNRITRTRPIFNDWAFVFEGRYDLEILDLDDIARIATTAGLRCGLGDFRPGSPKGGLYGRFVAVVESL